MVPRDVQFILPTKTIKAFNINSLKWANKVIKYKVSCALVDLNYSATFKKCVHLGQIHRMEVGSSSELFWMKSSLRQSME